MYIYCLRSRQETHKGMVFSGFFCCSFWFQQCSCTCFTCHCDKNVKWKHIFRQTIFTVCSVILDVQYVTITGTCRNFSNWLLIIVAGKLDEPLLCVGEIIHAVNPQKQQVIGKFQLLQIKLLKIRLFYYIIFCSKY